jgi:hypothetical protein
MITKGLLWFATIAFGLSALAALLFAYPKGLSTSPQSCTSQTDDRYRLTIDYPLPNSLVKSPARIAGSASWRWFSEGEIPVDLLDDRGKVLVKSHLTAGGDWNNWQTEHMVPFHGTLAFPATSAREGSLVFTAVNEKTGATDAVYCWPVLFH